jgi:hypothetical protein
VLGVVRILKHRVEKIKGRRSLLEHISLFPYVRRALLEREGPEKATRGGVNGNQLKFHDRT